MNVLVWDFQHLWLKIKRRFFQYSMQAIKRPDWSLMFAFSRFQIVRSFVRLISKKTLFNRYEQSDIFPEVDADRVVKALKDDSIYLGINLPQDILSEILSFAREMIYLGNGNEQFRFLLAEKAEKEAKYKESFAFGYHFNPSLRCPAIKKLEDDPKLWEIATKYFGTQPIVIGTMMWWSFATEKVEAEERLRFGQGLFHYDLEDYMCLKFMFYLTDVDLYSGPHVAVKGSHTKKKLGYQFSIVRDRDDKEISDYYGSENVLTLCGEAGFGFAEDPFCFHKGNSPARTDRLILEVKFGLNKYEM